MKVAFYGAVHFPQIKMRYPVEPAVAVGTVQLSMDRRRIVLTIYIEDLLFTCLIKSPYRGISVAQHAVLAVPKLVWLRGDGIKRKEQGKHCEDQYKDQFK